MSHIAASQKLNHCDPYFEINFHICPLFVTFMSPTPEISVLKHYILHTYVYMPSAYAHQ